MATATTAGFVATCIVQDATVVLRTVATLFPQNGYMVLEKVNDVQFMALDKAALAEALATCEAGRVFARQADLRWQRTRQGTFTMVLLTENAQHLSSSWQQFDLGWHTSRKRLIRLWGERQLGWEHWVEGRIPRSLNYPVTRSAGAVHVKCIEYYDQQGTPRFIRFQEVQ